MGGKGEEEKRERWLVYVNIKVEAGPDLYHQLMIKFSPTSSEYTDVEYTRNLLLVDQ